VQAAQLVDALREQCIRCNLPVPFNDMMRALYRK